MLIGLSPSGPCAIPNRSLYYAGQWISVIQVMLAVANWQEESPTTASHYNTGLQWGAVNAKQAPPSAFLHLQGFDPTPFASLALKTFMYHISRGKGRCREKAILAYSKRHTRGLCVSTTEYSEASLCIYNKKPAPLQSGDEHNGVRREERQTGIPDLLTSI